MTREQIEQLEKLVDTYSLAQVVEALATIASEKADHIRSNWQDEHMAKCWERAAIRLDKVSAQLQ